MLVSYPFLLESVYSIWPDRRHFVWRTHLLGKGGGCGGSGADASQGTGGYGGNGLLIITYTP
jgi:hypothetical protein